MKRFLVAICSLVVVVSACSKDDDNPVGGGNNTTTLPASAFSAKINGQSWAADTTYCSKYLLDTTMWEISGEKGEIFLGGSDINLILESKAVGTYSYNPTAPFDNRFLYSQSLQNTFMSQEGQVTITESTDKYVKGTFAFKTKDQNTNTTNYTITEGSFTSHVRK